MDDIGVPHGVTNSFLFANVFLSVRIPFFRNQCRMLLNCTVFAHLCKGSCLDRCKPNRAWMDNSRSKKGEEERKKEREEKKSREEEKMNTTPS